MLKQQYVRKVKFDKRRRSRIEREFGNKQNEYFEWSLKVKSLLTCIYVREWANLTCFHVKNFTKPMITIPQNTMLVAYIMWETDGWKTGFFYFWCISLQPHNTFHTMICDAWTKEYLCNGHGTQVPINHHHHSFTVFPTSTSTKMWICQPIPDWTKVSAFRWNLNFGQHRKYCVQKWQTNQKSCRMKSAVD